jgi:pimeloyl-ACP methyl ester carboxylesterase
MLTTTEYGSATGTPLLIVHGLFGSARNWGVVAKRLSAQRRVLTVDMRNHGLSFHSDNHDYPPMAGDLAKVIAHHGGRADVLGHSMGGKTAMVLALSRPELVSRLIVADIAPVAYGHTQMPLVRAMQGLDLSQVTKRSDADGLLARTVESPAVRAFLLQSLDVANRSWRLNLPALAANMESILSFPQVTGQFNGPTLFLTGADSDYVQPIHRPEIRARFPQAKFAKIPGAGHWLHADKPREFEAAVEAFLTLTT